MTDFDPGDRCASCDAEIVMNDPTDDQTKHEPWCEVLLYAKLPPHRRELMRGRLVARTIQAALLHLPEDARNGFLFALCISDMLIAGWTKERIKEELLKGLDIAWNETHA